ncbi:response regulator [Sulfuricurvum sp.]|uniref:response regulator n=1 Tax=Sulfuricurvum sp. TaxID=2025608 RepID=UPI002E375584|nr:response regulator [Sulfuricurvum sp.]HEX5329764.1 response regulator [Sulfuricurvum sp.]
MGDPNVLKQLRANLHTYPLLYVEDNRGLNAQATVLFKKFFDNVISGYDGEEGLALFEKHRPAIVITDINMPKMDGLKMSEAIHEIDPDVLIIITTAHDERDFLHQSIKIGVFDYLIKPLKIDNLIETFTRCSEMLVEAFHRKIFNANLHAVFNYQNNLVILLHERNVVIANQPTLDFFGVKNIEALRKRFQTFGEVLLEHKSFVYDHGTMKWFEHISAHPKRLFNVKIADQEEVSHHFILTYQSVPEKDGYAVLSLNDVTELGLLKLYDSNATERESLIKDEKTVRALLEMAMRSSAKMKVHNLYKGLSIVNDGIVESIEGKTVSIKSAYVQLKAMQYEKMFYLTSELFPMTILAEGIRQIDLGEQYVLFSQYRLVPTSPARRESIRVTPDNNIAVTMLYEERRFDAELEIMDVSISGMRVQLFSLPAGFAVKHSVILDIVLTTASRPIIINTTAEVFRIDEVNRRFEVVFVFNLHDEGKKGMIDYIAKRQMVLIREFKGIQYEK